ncbi:MAG: hypothetical protein RLZZ401_228, partial [Pseudomonadota bacterium]
KVHPHRLDAFSSGEAGTLGLIDQGSVHWNREIAFEWAPSPLLQPVFAIENIATKAWPRVEIIVSHAGADGRLVDLLLAERQREPDAGVRGLVVAGTGNGTVHADLEAALLRAQAQGVAVVRSTRCVLGAVLPKASDVTPHAPGLNPAKARVALMMALLGGGLQQ